MRNFVSSAEAAYIANLTDRQINRLVDEDIAPLELVNQDGKTRRFTRLYAALAKFYCETESVFQSKARRQVMHEVVARIRDLPNSDQLYDLSFAGKEDSVIWLVQFKGYPIDIEPFITKCVVRAKEMDQADAVVRSDDDILSDTPVYSGTRLPIENVLIALERGSTVKELIVKYPFMTPIHIDAARVYDAVHPRRGRPRRLQELHPDLVLKVRRTLRAV